MRPTNDIEKALSAHGAAVWRMCVLYFGNGADAQDAYQDAFLKYALADEVAFKDDEHRKAWLLRVTSNTCKDLLKMSERKNVPLADMAHDPADQPESFRNDVIDAVRRMDDPPRTPLYLSLVEEYSAPEIASLMGAPVNTVYSWLSRGKRLLREALQ